MRPEGDPSAGLDHGPREEAPARADASEATTGASVMRGGAWTALAHLAPQLATLVVSVAAARYLGPEGMGRQSFISFVQLSIVWLLTGGLSISLMRSIGEALGAGRPEGVRGLIRWAWRLQILGTLLGGGALALVAAAGADPAAAWGLAAVVCAMGVMHTLPSAVLIGMQRWREASILGVATAVVAGPSTIAVLAAGGGIAGMFAVEAVISTLNLLGTVLLARRGLAQLPTRVGEAGDLTRQAGRYAAVTSVSVVLTLIIWRRSEFFFLERYSSDAEIAFYSVAFAAVTTFTVLSERLASVLSPAFATLFGAGATERIRVGYARALRLMLIGALPITAGGLAVGPALLAAVYGDEYGKAGPALLVLFVVVPLVPVMNLSGALLTGLARARAPLVAGGAAASVNLVLDVLLIPSHAALGAAMANAGAQVTAAFGMYLYATRALGEVHWDPLSLGRSAVASGAAGLAGLGGVLLVEGIVGVGLGVVAGIVAFAALAVALRILPSDDAAWLDSTFSGRLGGAISLCCRLAARPAHGGVGS